MSIIREHDITLYGSNDVILKPLLFSRYKAKRMPNTIMVISYILV